MQILTLEAEKVPWDISKLIIFWALMCAPILYILILFFPLTISSIIHSLIKFFDSLPSVVSWLLFSAIPATSFFIFKNILAKYTVIYIEPDKLTLDNLKSFKEVIRKNDISEILAFRTPPLNMQVDLLNDLHYWTKLPMCIRIKDGRSVTILTRGEVFNSIKDLYNDVPLLQVGIINKYTFLLLIIGIFNILNLFFLYIEIISVVTVLPTWLI